METTNVPPILKKSDLDLISNYRLIFILSKKNTIRCKI